MAVHGATLISTQLFDQYQVPALRAMRASHARAHLYYDPDVRNRWPPVFRAAHLDALLNAGVATIALRTAETEIAWEQVAWQLDQDMGGGQSVIAYIRARQQARFVLEVGNEPNEAGADPWAHRYRLLTVAQNLKGPYGSDNLTWAASLPTPRGTDAHPGMQYADVILSGGEVAGAYDALAAHAYAYTDLVRADGAQPFAMVDKAAQTGRPVWITEAGINGPMPWSEKGARYGRFVAGLPANVRGAAFFTLGLDPAWSAYTIDVAGGQIDWNFTGSKAIAGSAFVPPPPSPQQQANRTLLVNTLGRDYPGTEAARYLGAPLREGRFLARQAGVGASDEERWFAHEKNAHHTLGGQVYSFFSEAAALLNPVVAPYTFGALRARGLLPDG